MKVFIRADGGNNIGIGHIMRMLVLAKELSKNNKVIFICKSSEMSDNFGAGNIEERILTCNVGNDKFKVGIEKVRENGFEILFIREKYLIEDIIDLQNKYKADLIITDSYDVDEEYFNKLKSHFMLSGYVDDVNKYKMNVDFLINQNINAMDMDYRTNVNHDTKLFLGTKYCMLRDEFRENYNKKQTKEKVKDLFLTLGGMDERNNTLKILKQILNFNINIHVVIGSAFKENLVDKLYNLSNINSNIKVYENANMSVLMKKCDIAISACGSTLYELCAMNIPTIGIIIAKNQNDVGKMMKKEFLLAEAYLIDEIEGNNLSDSLNELINNKKLREDISIRQGNLVNIYGVELLVNEINKEYGTK